MTHRWKYEGFTEIGGQINTNDTNPATLAHQVDSLGENLTPTFLPVGIYVLVANTIACSVNALRLVLHDLSDRIAFAEVDGDGADALGFSETLGNTVDAVDFACTSEEG